MALLIPLGFAQVTIPIRHTALAREAVVTFGIEDGDLPAAATPAYCDLILTAWMSTWGTELGSDIVSGPVRLRAGTLGEPISVEGTESEPGGAGAVVVVPSNVALLVRKLTARGGRRGRGRMYIPWIIPVTNVSETGLIDAGLLVGYQGESQNFLDELEAAPPAGPGASMVLLHESEGGTAPGSPDTVTSAPVDGVVATQRRRLDR